MLHKAKRLIPLLGVLAILAATTLIRSPHVRADGAGLGSVANPYLISTCQQLQDITNDLYGNYVVINDIDCSDTINWNSGKGFIPIGIGTSGEIIDVFHGYLNGGGHTISQIYINQETETSQASVGVFYGFSGKLFNFKVVGAHITGRSPQVDDSNTWLGGIAGQAYGSISGVSFDGTITASQTAGSACNIAGAGGLAGVASGTIDRSSSTGTIVIDRSLCNDNGYAYIGGLVGVMDPGVIRDSYANMAITVSGASCSSYYCMNIGGLVGILGWSQPSIYRSYASGSIDVSVVASDWARTIGGLVGYYTSNTSINDSFSDVAISTPPGCVDANCTGGPWTIGGILGFTSYNPTFNLNYYDQTASGVSNCFNGSSSGCTAVNTDGFNPGYFKNNSLNSPFNDWDFDNTWQTTSGLPVLKPYDPAPGAPTNIASEIVSASSIKVTWDPPTESGSSGIGEYMVLYKKTSSTSWFVTDYSIYADPTETVLNNLDPGTQYDIKVVARNSDGYYGVASENVVGTTATPGSYLINNCQQLQDINNDLAGTYELAKNIDCSETATWNDGHGFIPIGFTTQEAEPGYFNGILKGNNYGINGLYQDYAYSGFIGYMMGSVQDLTFTNSVLHISGADHDHSPMGSVVAMYLFGDGTLTNVHATNAIIQTNQVQIVGGLVAMGYIGGTISRSSFEGTIAGSYTMAGGLMGQAYSLSMPEYNIDGVHIIDSYARIQTVLSDSMNTEFNGAGGLIAYVGTDDDTPATITNSYASGSMDFTNSTMPVLTGGIFGAVSEGTIINSFSRMDMLTSPNVMSAMGGVLSTTQVFGVTPTTIGVYANTNLDQSNVCSADQAVECTPIADASYFYNNHTNPPLNQWDFNDTWQTTSALPVHKAATGPSVVQGAHGSPPGIILPRFLRLPSLFGIGTPEGAAAVSTGAPVATTRFAAKTTVDDKSSNPFGQVITSFKEFVKGLPPEVVVAFPYALFGLLGIGILVLLIELGFELRRTHLLEALIHKQQLLAEERDAFWHLAANYLRAPVTLIVGGAEALRESRVNESTTAIAALAGNLQVKVGEIMSKIEGSTSLQAIKGSQEQTVIKVARKAIFIAPLSIVALLVLLGNYAAVSYRSLDPGFIGYTAQLIIFMIVTIVLYWAIGLLNRGKSKRKAAEAQFAMQTSELNNARHELIEETAKILNPDLTKLESQIKMLPAATAAAAVGAIATLRDGSNRLREIVSSFALLIKVQEGTGRVAVNSGSIDLTGILNKVRSKLTPQITTKSIRITAPAVTLPVSAESEMAQQVLESILANAVDYSPTGGTVKVEARKLEDSIQLRISDQGKGIDKKQLDHLFQPFVRADGTSAMDMSHGGFGINLYIDKLIMEQLGGSISAVSKPGKGTVFTMTWPIASN